MARSGVPGGRRRARHATRARARQPALRGAAGARRWRRPRRPTRGRAVDRAAAPPGRTWTRCSLDPGGADARDRGGGRAARGAGLGVAGRRRTRLGRLGRGPAHRPLAAGRAPGRPAAHAGGGGRPADPAPAGAAAAGRPRRSRSSPSPTRMGARGPTSPARSAPSGRRRAGSRRPPGRLAGSTRTPQRPRRWTRHSTTRRRPGACGWPARWSSTCRRGAAGRRVVEPDPGRRRWRRSRGATSRCWPTGVSRGSTAPCRRRSARASRTPPPVTGPGLRPARRPHPPARHHRADDRPGRTATGPDDRRAQRRRRRHLRAAGAGRAGARGGVRAGLRDAAPGRSGGAGGGDRASPTVRSTTWPTSPPPWHRRPACAWWRSAPTARRCAPATPRSAPRSPPPSPPAATAGKPPRPVVRAVRRGLAARMCDSRGSRRGAAREGLADRAGASPPPRGPRCPGPSRPPRRSPRTAARPARRAARTAARCPARRRRRRPSSPPGPRSARGPCPPARRSAPARRREACRPPPPSGAPPRPAAAAVAGSSRSSLPCTSLARCDTLCSASTPGRVGTSSSAHSGRSAAASDSTASACSRRSFSDDSSRRASSRSTASAGAGPCLRPAPVPASTRDETVAPLRRTAAPASRRPARPRRTTSTTGSAAPAGRAGSGGPGGPRRRPAGRARAPPSPAPARIRATASATAAR